jgi:hypothetical protein
MFEASVDEHPASPQYLLPMEYTHADGDAEVAGVLWCCITHTAQDDA